jgi:hypothetical protein
VSAAASHAEYAAGLEKVHTEAAGALHVSLICAEQRIELLCLALLGNPEAMMLTAAITDSAAWIKRATRREPVLCLCCPRRIKRITPATIFGVVSPAIPSPGHAVGFAFCDVCAGKPGLMDATTAALKKIWPNLRPIVVTHPRGGTA